jgi:hypothetical protein
LNPADFKGYEELKTKLNKVLGVGSDFKPRSKTVEETLEVEEDVPFTVDSSGDDDTLSYFNKLASE